MEGRINTQTVKQFIHNFTKNYLNRSLDSLVTIQAKDTHNHFVKNEGLEKTEIVIRELNTTYFLPTVTQKNMVCIS